MSCPCDRASVPGAPIARLSGTAAPCAETPADPGVPGEPGVHALSALGPGALGEEPPNDTYPFMHARPHCPASLSLSLCQFRPRYGILAEAPCRACTSASSARPVTQMGISQDTVCVDPAIRQRPGRSDPRSSMLGIGEPVHRPCLPSTWVPTDHMTYTDTPLVAVRRVCGWRGFVFSPPPPPPLPCIITPTMRTYMMYVYVMHYYVAGAGKQTNIYYGPTKGQRTQQHQDPIP